MCSTLVAFALVQQQMQTAHWGYVCHAWYLHLVLEQVAFEGVLFTVCLSHSKTGGLSCLLAPCSVGFSVTTLFA